MPSYIVVGASRGIGYEFLKTLSADSSNTVIGLARDPAATQAKVDADKLKNVHVLQGDLTSAASLNAAAKQVADITGKSVDYLIINGAYLSPETMFMKSSDFVGKEEFFLNEFTMSMNTNVVGTLFAVNAFISLVKNSAIKKIIVITSGHASTEAMEIAGVDNTIPYAISKVAVNALVTKMAIEYRDEGVVFLALSPGVVNTAEDANNMPPALVAAYEKMRQSFLKLEPDWKGPITPKESVDLMMKVMDGVTLKESGAFLSHHGNQHWL